MVVFKKKIFIPDSCNTFLKIDKEIWNTDTSLPPTNQTHFYLWSLFVLTYPVISYWNKHGRYIKEVKVVRGK